jgi:signal transduction histidine kinase/ligand-binding sensor domain-containing protein
LLRATGAFAADPLLETRTGSSPEFVVTTWRMQQGLPSDRVRAVLQARDGYLWVATFNGAARFDGVRFRVFNDANTPALRNSLASCVFEDAERRLWLGSDTGEITWRDAEGFHALTVTNAWPNSPIDRLVQGGDGTLWVLSREGFILCVRNLKPEAVLGDAAGPLYSDVVRDRDGQVWAVRYGGFLMRLGEGKALPAEDMPRPPRDYRTIAAARQGGLWMRDGSRLHRWYRGQWVEDRGEHSWRPRQAVVLHEAANGSVWVGTRDDGAFVVAADGSEHHIHRATGLAYDLVSDICDDREGNIWLASDAGGLCMLRPRALFMVNPPDEWQHRPIRSVAPSRDGGLWVGTEGAGVYKLHNSQATALSASNSPTAKDIRTVLEDRSGKLWVGTEVRERLISGLLVQSRGRLEVGTQVGGLLLGTNELLRPVTRADTHIEMPMLYYAIYQSRDGALWMGSNQGLVRQQEDQWSRLGAELYRPEVRCITETPDGAIWIGMRGGGVACYRDGKFNQYLRARGLPYEYAWAMLGDTDGSVWIGTPGAGLIRWRDGQFVSFTERQGLPSDFICSVLADRQGVLWLSSYAGILKVAKADLDRCARGETASVNCLVLDESDGLASLEMAGGNQPTACATADGRLWFATSGGLALVDPARIRTNALPPPVLLEEVVVDGKVLLPTSSSFSSSSSLPEADLGSRTTTRTITSTSEAVTIVPNSEGPVVLRVPPGSGQIELRYTALSFCAPQRVRFRYRLEKVDPDWVHAGTRRSAYYAHLAPGRYRFQVVACNNDGVWSPDGVTATLEVQPFFWQTWWFAPCCWLGGICVAGAGTIATLRRRHRVRIGALERARLVERERGRIARDLHDDLGSGLTDISTTSSLGQHPSVSLDEAHEYFGEIGQRSNEMVMALDEIVWAVNPKNDDLSSLATYFSQFTEHFVRLTPLRCRFEIPEALPRLPLNAEQRHSLYLAFKEALQNTVKHAAASSLQVSIAVEAGTLSIIVEDDGRGFEPGVPKPGADGLRNMRERLEQLGGQCEISTAPGKGTRVTFRVPIRGAPGTNA